MSRHTPDAFDHLWQAAELSRRQVLASGAATGTILGFAACVQPVMAQTVILTDPAGLDHGMITIETPAGPVAAYLAAPAAARRRPLVLVVQEIFGLHEHIKDVCRRFAKQGYCAIAPSLFDRQGDVTRLTSFDEIRPIVARVPDAQVMADLDATVAWAVGSGAADGAKVAVTGFCWGGRITWLYAAHKADLKAGVAWYGRLVGEPSANQPKHPVDLAAALKGPVLGLYGGQDTGIPLSTVEQMRVALPAGSPSRIHIYPDSPHAFFADYRPSYRAADAADGWTRCLGWLGANGVA
jgi:carboxymethylenebutenolidase